MAEIAGIASFTSNEYRQLPCPLCRYWLKVQIYPYAMRVDKPYKCKRCNAKLTLEIIEEDEMNGGKSIRVNISVTTTVKPKRTMQLKKID